MSHLIEWNQALHSCLSETWVTARSTSVSHLSYCPVCLCLWLLLLAALTHTLLLIMPSLSCTESSLAQSPSQAPWQTGHYINSHTSTYWLTHMCNHSQRYWTHTHEFYRAYSFTSEVCALVVTLNTHTRLGVADAVASSFHLSAFWQESSVAAGECSTYQLHSANLQLLGLHLPHRSLYSMACIQIQHGCRLNKAEVVWRRSMNY